MEKKVYNSDNRTTGESGSPAALAESAQVSSRCGAAARSSGLRELILYCVIGCTGAGLDFLIYMFLAKCAGVHYQVANLIGVNAGIINNFILNRHFNFKTQDRVLLRLGCFYAVGMLGCALSAVCLWLFIERMGLGTAVSKLGTIALVTIVQFCLNKFITFRKSAKGKGKETSDV